MMLHEAVMLEIYRQALTASELASPTRCLSRDSRESTGGGRSPSDESIYSGRGLNISSPLGMALPAALPPALLPPQSAAMAAYLGVAAAAAQQNRLNFFSGLSGSPPLLPPGLALSDIGAPILDFSTKRSGGKGELNLDGSRVSDSNDKRSINGSRGRERSGSESSSFSDRASSRLESLTPEKKFEPAHRHQSPDRKSESLDDEKNGNLEESKVRIKSEPIESDDSVIIKKERLDADEEGESKSETELNKLRKMSSPISSPQRTSPMRTPTASPASDRSITPKSVSDSKQKGQSNMPGSSLGALSSMFDNLTGSGNNDSGANNSGSNSTKEGGGGKKTASHHPLAALQKLCDKTENTPAQQQNSRTNSASSNNSSTPLTVAPQSSSNPPPPQASNPGSGLLAFSWACNDAVMTADSIMKCAFCDTPFISKGAYRHHLSKMHFIKDDMLADTIAIKPMNSQRSSNATPSIASKSPTPPAVSPKSANGLVGLANSRSRSKSPSVSSPVAPNQPSTPNSATFEESPHSKFLKYTELAKQLSSKYV